MTSGRELDYSGAQRLNLNSILIRSANLTGREDLTYLTNTSIERISQQHFDLSPVLNTEFDVGPENNYVNASGFVHGNIIRLHKRLQFNSIRIARSTLIHSELNYNNTTLCSIFSSLSQLAPSHIYTNTDLPIITPNMLACAHCDASIPSALLLAHLTQLSIGPRSTQLLLDAAARFHAPGCCGQKSLEILHEDDTHLGAPESMHCSLSLSVASLSGKVFC